MKTIQHFLSGKSFSGQSKRTGKVFNPATGEQSAEVKLANTKDVDQAVADAKKAFEMWSNKPPLQRARVMFKFKELIEKNSKELTEIIVSEHGKVFEDAKGSLTRGLEVVEYACGIPEMLKGDFTENVGTNVDSWSIRQPLGVCAGITPFNFPAMIAMWRFGVAIACGCTFILKPSEKDPGVPLKLAELMIEAGAPEGVLNVVNGDKVAVDALIENPTVKAVSFVGSSDIASYVYSRCAEHGKRVQAMGGAKNHGIILPDADLPQAVKDITGAAYGSAGERCMALSAVVTVGEETGDAFVAAMREELSRLKVGISTDPQADYGPVVSAVHKAKIESYIRMGVDEGAELSVDGRGFSLQGYENGFFIGPSLFYSVQPTMTDSYTHLTLPTNAKV